MVSPQLVGVARSHVEAAVDGQRLARDEAGIITAQVAARGRDLDGAETAHRGPSGLFAVVACSDRAGAGHQRGAGHEHHPIAWRWRGTVTTHLYQLSIMRNLCLLCG